VNKKVLLKGFKKPKSITYEKEEQTPNYGKFIISPFEKGFGYTFGNVLRRVLLSSIPGYAISAIRVQTKNSNGEVKILSSCFEQIPEVYEDTLDVINNLKNVKVKLLDDIEQKTISIEKKGGGVVKAGDLQIDDTIEIINKDLTIMTLSDKADIEMDIQIDWGRGYVDAERQEEYVETIDTIPIDAMYSPIEKVKYEVTNTRVGQRTDYDKLILEVWTNGTILPEDAIGSAAKLLKEQLQVLINFEEEGEAEELEQQSEDEDLKTLFETPIDELELSVRASNCLRTVNIKTIGDLVSKSEDKIAKIRHFGKKSLLEIKEKLAKYKLTFGMEDVVNRVLKRK